MTTLQPDDWSPADNPYAIAVSEAQWGLSTVELALLRIERGEEDWNSWFSSVQIDARQVVHGLRHIMTAEHLEQMALNELAIDSSVGNALAQARQHFEETLPGIKDMRDALTHFEDWSRGQGRFGPQKKLRDAGKDLRDIARTFSGFGCDPASGTITLGPYTIHVETARQAAHELCQAICTAAHDVDKKNAADVLAQTVQALTNACIPFNESGTSLRVSSDNVRVWVSLRGETSEDSHPELAGRVASVLTKAGLSLISSSQPQSDDGAESLASGEALFVKLAP